MNDYERLRTIINARERRKVQEMLMNNLHVQERWKLLNCMYYTGLKLLKFTALKIKFQTYLT